MRFCSLWMHFIVLSFLLFLSTWRVWNTRWFNWWSSMYWIFEFVSWCRFWSILFFSHTFLSSSNNIYINKCFSAGPVTGMARVWDYLSGSALLRNFNLRVHKFTFQVYNQIEEMSPWLDLFFLVQFLIDFPTQFCYNSSYLFFLILILQWDLALHFSICIVSLAPFSFTGDRLYAIFPISVWAFYNILVLIGTRCVIIIPFIFTSVLKFQYEL